MGNITRHAAAVIKTVVGCALFALGLDFFLLPNGANAGGISGLSMILVHLLGIGSVGLFNALFNLPLFVLGAFKLGKQFVVGSLLGMMLCTVFIDLLALLPVPDAEPLIGAIYGGCICGLGLGIVFSTGYCTGGSDIIVRLLKLRWQNMPIGMISIVFDALVAVLTGIVFRDLTRGLYSGVAIYLSGRVIDAVVYRFDYSKVAMIVSRRHEDIANGIFRELGRGATYLQAQGSYTGNNMKVILTVVKRQQLAELKQLVTDIDPEAFVIVQEAHQVLGDGFAKYSKESL